MIEIFDEDRKDPAEPGDLVQIMWRGKLCAKGIVISVEKIQKSELPSVLPSPPSYVLNILGNGGVVYQFDIWKNSEVEIIQSFKNPI